MPGFRAALRVDWELVLPQILGSQVSHIERTELARQREIPPNFLGIREPVAQLQL